MRILGAMGNPPVLIVGAGPVGLMLATECRRHGVPFRIVDKNPAHSLHSKALVIWSGTLEHLAAAGLAESFLAAARPIRKMVLHDMGQRVAEIHVSEGLESPYPTPVILPQSHTEELLLANLRERGVEIERNTECVGVRSESDHIECDLQRSDGTLETIQPEWLAACDGARSIVRHHVPVEFAGLTEELGFVLADAKTTNAPPDDSIFLSTGPSGAVILFPIKPGVHRFFALRQNLDDRSLPTLEEIQTHVDDAGLSQLRLSEPEWLSYFAVNERVASRNRVGRIFLLGDASHIHSPAGGQGMNTGMQDAFNLGWKLKLLTSGRGDTESIAESYFEERHPVAEKVVRETSRLLHFGILSQPVVRMAKKVILPIFAEIRTFQQRAAFALSGLGISYPTGSLIGRDSRAFEHHHHALKPGTLARDAEIRRAGSPGSLWRELLHPAYSLLLFSAGSPSERVADLISATMNDLRDAAVRTFVIWQGVEQPASLAWNQATVLLDPDGVAHSRYGAREITWYLIRPDQYIAARGVESELSLLREYLQKTFGIDHLVVVAIGLPEPQAGGEFLGSL
jgi:2-polyprenyl-6-methoxyphenol hydroxylase-like FAD-dependent oxidoreductase